MLYSRRKRLQDLADREAAGESFWTEYLDERARGRLAQELSHFQRLVWERRYSDVLSPARAHVLREEGLLRLAGPANSEADVAKCMASSEPDLVFSLIEAVAEQIRGQGIPESFDQAISTVLREERVAFDFVEGQIVPKGSLELHEAVVAPTITLLGGNPAFSKIESAYRSALEEIHNGSPGDAITDAATALQETLVHLGCDGNALGPLVASAIKKGLLAPYDPTLIKGMLDWVSADRSQKGDSHKAEGDDIQLSDAWLTVHVVGALIVRLVSEHNR